jgi:Phosphorylated CTD interacting factor 1 WW domain
MPYCNGKCKDGYKCNRYVSFKYCWQHGAGKKNKYAKLNAEIDKINALNQFKDTLIQHIIQYFRYNKLHDTQKIEYKLANLFPNWFFQLNTLNKITSFIPSAPFQIQEHLDYIFNERKIAKKNNFDKKLLLFNVKDIKHVTNVIEISKKVENNYVTYVLNTNYNLMPISIVQYNHLVENYRSTRGEQSARNARNTQNKDKFDEYLCIILVRYKFLGGLNNHLSVPPSVYKFMNIDCELFGSPLNTICKKYCSPFPDYEKYFGSMGSFFNYKLESNLIYGVNPPFDAKIITKMVKKIETELAVVKNVTLYVIIPKWEDNFEGYELLRKSKYLKATKIELPKSLYPYYSYLKLQYMSVVDSLLFILSNTNNYKSPMDIKNIWRNSNK